ncbi:MAG: hypothetical protein M3N07_04790 [Pseudomonadota bacterium]|nr:hypothetical protein [Pseudomonadota bacterium]
MGPAIYLIAILGCGEGAEPCEPVAIAEPRYESREACLAATEAQLARRLDLQYPIVVAQCFEEGAEPERLMPAEVMLPGPDRRPSAWD